ncbi:Hypothetical protein PHPALM_36197 [Phytophthora palmivora]|uniref:Uncharacterized protein n=1 Tax=Phytophthora palmivora TaxID=4796 RepID=A0A2P4X0J9_9STRA|nr:Hypothetical protein PHPALM_36197 [Phytophthora palmivora]
MRKLATLMPLWSLLCATCMDVARMLNDLRNSNSLYYLFMLHIVLMGGVIFLRFKRVKTAFLQGISLFKDPTNL